MSRTNQVVLSEENGQKILKSVKDSVQAADQYPPQLSVVLIFGAH